TSGVDYRRWQHGDVVLHHVIDPRIGISAETDLSTCSVLAADACRAEAWATATLVAGAELGYSRLVEQQLAGVTISQTGETMLTPALQPHVQLECGQRLL
ncbi:MAG: FAD:protein FMN transferase, partial [Candidatus Promineifilaceae bacterium]